MAAAKVSSASGPKPGQSRSEKTQGLDITKLIGAQVSVTTCLNDTFEGTVFTLDRQSSILALIETVKSSGQTSESSEPPTTTRLVSLSAIQNIQVLAPSAKSKSRTPSNSANPRIHPINVALAEKRLADAIRREQMLAAKVGKGVTKEGQQIFDQLERQYDCRWHEKNIIVLDVVMITPPYTQESCRAKPEHANQLERVKKMLDNIRARMSDGSRLPEAGGPKGKVVPAIPASGQRKGG